MFGALRASMSALPRAPGVLAAAVAAGLMLAACTGTGSPGDFFSGAPAGPPRGGSEIGGGNIKVALILPLSSGGNAGVTAQSMRNAAELALAEFNAPDISLLVKDDAGSAGRRPAGGAAGARRGCRNHPRAAVRAFGRAGRAAGAHPRHPGDRLLDRLQCRRARRLPLELPAGVRCRPADRLCRTAGQAGLCRRDPGQSLRHRGRGRVQAIRRAAQRTHRRARALFGRPRA